MPKVIREKSGFSHLIIIICAAVLVLGLGTLAFMKVRNRNNAKSSGTPAGNYVINPSETTTDQTSEPTEATKTKLELVGTPYYISIPTGWTVSENTTHDLNEDGTLDSSKVQLTKSGWILIINADHGGFGGGAGCYLSSEEPVDGWPKCPHYKLLESTTLTDGYKFARIEVDKADGTTGACSIITDADRLNKNFQTDYPEADLWVCFSQANVVNLTADANIAASLHTTLNKSSGADILATDLSDPTYQEAEAILQSLAKE